MMAVGGLVSFGHAAYFGLGSYGVAMLAKLAGLPMGACLLLGPVMGLIGAVVFGWFCVRLSGVYFAMLTLAFAQIVWSVAFQWVEVTGGDNGMLGIWPAEWEATPQRFYWLRWRSPRCRGGAARAGVRAVRLRVAGDARFRPAQRAIASTASACNGSPSSLRHLRRHCRALFAYLQGIVFSRQCRHRASWDSLGWCCSRRQTVSGAVVGAIVYKALSIWL